MAISQRLQTKLAQKLILTPSLQQAIKLLPMSTLELADLLTQEVVENPLLEEIPTEDLQAADAQPATEKEPEAPKVETKNDTWDDADYEYFFGEYLEDSYRPKAPAGSARAAPDREHALHFQLAHRSSRVAALAPDRRRPGPGDRRGDHRQPR